ncbi:hypothetical protein LAZ67_9002732 [Cordylochernes scorpioides]|uniref:Integrase catalytic domain-containing protein n=1 Tax=Cordylochernes scorpioides TaxID=51811 RepID=A0ABY6KUI0_9ARAC|nr:hypothetical protein LAZ67_9002732 [Cordylochernes scorpioides]
MENVMPYESEINLAEESKVTHATAKGDIKVSTCTENGIENVQIKGVLHVPNLRSNLLSIYELTNKGNTVIFNRDGAKIYNEQDDLIAEAQIQDRMYVMETRSRDEYSEKTENVMTTKDDFSNDNISLWHRRLNHLNEAYMKEIIQQNMVLGFNVKFKNLPECEACIMRKLTRQPYHSVTTNCTTKPLELVHMDLCGPMPYQSLGGSKYFFVLVDDFSRRTFIYFLKNKDETLGKFEEFKARVENELNLKMKDVRTDNSTEFTNHRFKNFLIKNGIHHQLSTTYSPQSNGVAERVNRTLIETARTLLFDSGLPMAFWAEAVATASYVKNCTPHRSIKLDTPMEKWKGRKPSIRHFRIFGCLAFWPITQQHRSKFVPKSRKGIFVGYSLKRKAYRVYDTITKKIEEVRSVKFVENEKGIDYAKNLQEDTNYDHFSYKKEEEDDIEIDHRTRPETSELNEETIPTLDEPNEERIVRSGRKKGDTQKVLEQKHRAKLREKEMKLLEQGVRRSQRIKERNNVNFILEPEERIPENYEEAINCENKYEWLEAMKEELYSIDKHKVWTLVQREKNMKIINCKWIFSIKSTPGEGVYRRKAKLVAIGCNQKYGVEYEESFSPVIRKESLRAIVALAAQLNLVITSYDVKTAYLYGELKETIFMKQPEGFVEKAGTDKTFNEKLASEIGRFVALKEKGENEPFIGIEIRKTEYGFDLSQAHYIDKILKKFALEECNIVQTPGDRDQSFDECQDSKPVDRTLYQEMIGSLMYLATGTRPDISFNGAVDGIGNRERRPDYACSRDVIRDSGHSADLAIELAKSVSPLNIFVADSEDFMTLLKVRMKSNLPSGLTKVIARNLSLGWIFGEYYDSIVRTSSILVTFVNFDVELRTSVRTVPIYTIFDPQTPRFRRILTIMSLNVDSGRSGECDLYAQIIESVYRGNPFIKPIFNFFAILEALVSQPMCYRPIEFLMRRYACKKMYFSILMSALKSMFERFDENLENVENYIYRLKQFMLISKTKEDFKTPFLISCIGPKYFGILRNLVFPEEVDQVPFDKLCRILLKHFNPKTNIIYERFVFQKMDQKSGETISKYIIRLKKQFRR